MLAPDSALWGGVHFGNLQPVGFYCLISGHFLGGFYIGQLILKAMGHITTIWYLIRDSEKRARCSNVYSLFRISGAVTYKVVPFEKLVGTAVVALSSEEKFLILSGR